MVSLRGHRQDERSVALVAKIFYQVAWDVAMLLSSRCVGNSDAHSGSTCIIRDKEALINVNANKYYLLGVAGSHGWWRWKK